MILTYFYESKYAGCAIASLGLLVSLVFVVVIYPQISVSYNAVLDTDRYGSLGYGMWKNASLSYYPDIQSTVNRGPVYPLFMASLLKITNGWWPLCVQIAQCFLFSLTCLLVFSISRIMWNQKVAIMSSLICAVHPFLFWYTSRIWIETLATFLFTSLVAVVVYFSLKQTIWRAVLVGVILAVCTLCKQTFLPFIIIIPVLLGMINNDARQWRRSFCVFVTAIILISPWTLRNWQHSNKLIPVHLLAGFNFQVGDSFIDDFDRSPFSYEKLWISGFKKVTDIADQQEMTDTKLADQEVLLDSIYLHKSLDRYLQNPGFFVRKIMYNTVLYWTLGETRLKSGVISLMQIPLVLLFVLSAVRIVIRYGIRSIQAVPVIMVSCYFAFHLPIFAFARLSVVLVPTMLVIGMSFFYQDRPSSTISK